MEFSSILAQAIRLVRGQVRVKSSSRRARSGGLVLEVLEERAVTTILLGPTFSLSEAPVGATGIAVTASLPSFDSVEGTFDPVDGTTRTGQTVLLSGDGRTALPGGNSVAGANQASAGAGDGFFTAFNSAPLETASTSTANALSIFLACASSRRAAYCIIFSARRVNQAGSSLQPGLLAISNSFSARR
jgi:hypothetical protein